MDSRLRGNEKRRFPQQILGNPWSPVILRPSPAPGQTLGACPLCVDTPSGAGTIPLNATCATAHDATAGALAQRAKLTARRRSNLQTASGQITALGS